MYPKNRHRILMSVFFSFKLSREYYFTLRFNKIPTNTKAIPI